MTAVRCTVTNPLVIRQALEHSDTHPHVATARDFGIAVSTLTTWRNRRAAAVADGGQWPSEDDISAWQASKARRDHVRVVRLRWLLRRAATAGPMLIDSTGTRRRLRALVAIGWRYSDIAVRLDVVTARVGHLAAGRSATVHRDTAAAIAAIYDELSMTPGPSPRNRALAAGRQWAPPLAWDDERIDDPKALSRRSGGRKNRDSKALDEIAIERAMAGDRVHLTPAERVEAARRLSARGLSLAQVADRMNVTKRSVSRHRAVA